MIKISKPFSIAVFILLFPMVSSHAADWCIQVSAFRNPDASRQDFGKLKNFQNARIEKNEGIHFLRVGRYSTEDGAKRGLKKIREQFPHAQTRQNPSPPFAGLRDLGWIAGGAEGLEGPAGWLCLQEAGLGRRV